LEVLLADLDVHLGGDLLILNSLGKFVGKRNGLAEHSVMLVGGLGEVLLGRLLGDGFLVGDNGVTLLKGALGELFLKILKANFDVELTATGDNVLTGVLSGADD